MELDLQLHFHLRMVRPAAVAVPINVPEALAVLLLGVSEVVVLVAMEVAVVVGTTAVPGEKTLRLILNTIPVMVVVPITVEQIKQTQLPAIEVQTDL